MLKQLSEVLAGLASPIPYDKCTAQPRRNKKYQGWCMFIIGTTKEAYLEMLDEHAPGWSCKVVHPPRLFNENLVQCTTEITIPALIGDQVHMLTRSAVGIVELKDGRVDGGYGNPVSNCATSSFKKAARLWGIGNHYQKPSIWMRMQGDQFPKYDPDRAGQPWRRGHEDQVPDQVRKAMREVRNPRNQHQAQDAMSQPRPAPMQEGQPRQAPPEFPTLAGLEDICGLKGKTYALPGVSDRAKFLRALVDSTPDYSPKSREQFLAWAVAEKKEINTPTKIRQAISSYELSLLS